jgi:bacterial/archaeal transporter family-2 protein
MFANGWFVLMALAAGAVITVQTGINTRLRSHLESPLQAVFVSFIVGTVLIGLALVVRRQAPPLVKLAHMPWWMWLGGVCGLFVVSTNIMAAPRIGAALLVALAITGQLVTALVLDHYGAFGFPIHHVSPARLLGAALLLAGVLLVRYN